MQFIAIKPDGQFHICSETVQILRASCGSDTFKVVSIAGNYRTGKSFLLNRLAKKNLFGTSPRVQAMTKGIWISREVVDGVLLVDTEGLGSTDVSSQHDLFIFALTIMLSNVILYNTVGAIQSDVITKLHVAEQFADHVSRKHTSSPRPTLMWICRDFGLQLLSAHGQPLTSDEYLHEQLIKIPTVHEALKTLFRSLQCTVLSKPCVVDALESVVDTAFERSTDLLRQRIIACNGHNSLDLLIMTSELMVKAFNESTLPVLDDIWTLTADIARRNALDAVTAEVHAFDMKDGDTRALSVFVMTLYQNFRSNLFRDHDKVDDFNDRVATALHVKEETLHTIQREQLRAIVESLPPSSDVTEVSRALGTFDATIYGDVIRQVFGILRGIDRELALSQETVYEVQCINAGVRDEIELYKSDILQAQTFETKLKQRLTEEKRGHDDIVSKHERELQALQASNDLLQQDMEGLQTAHKTRIDDVLRELDVEHVERQSALEKTTTVEREFVDLQTRFNDLQKFHKQEMRDMEHSNKAIKVHTNELESQLSCTMARAKRLEHDWKRRRTDVE